ncbi:DUF4870 domain-containing protein [Kordia sp.]|uniref:DUF4870 domain-containing protein n=1 Tax=Kordia sp. TaxID=1965332 RepID=UPI003D2BD2F5
MNEIGVKIKEARKTKGLTQEELSETAKINLRTIQRIESGESEPRGKTMLLICEALSLNVEDILNYGQKTDNRFLTFLYLSTLSFLIIPTGNIIIPLILWITNKDKIVGLKKAGIDLLNFQITWSIITYVCLICGVVFTTLMNFSKFKILFIAFFGLYIINMVLAIIAAIRANYGKTTNFPSLIKFVR